MSAASVTEGSAARLLADQLIMGGKGPRWSKAQVHGLFERSERALKLSKPWLPTHVWRSQKDLLDRARAQAARGAVERASDSQPADTFTASTNRPWCSRLPAPPAASDQYS